MLKKRILYYWDYNNKSQDETATNPAGVSGQAKYEINVSKNGRHVFATDGTIRNYNGSQIRDLILLFREKFPETDGYIIGVTCFNKMSQPIPDYVKAAIDGQYVKTKLDKRTKKGQVILDSLIDGECEE